MLETLALPIGTGTGGRTVSAMNLPVGPPETTISIALTDPFH